MHGTTSAASETVTHATGRSGNPDLRFLHYNDVYHVEAGSAEPVGGIARFQSLVNHYRSDAKFKGLPELLTFFSGDAFNPSLESSVTKGGHMVPVLNGIGTDVACVGNHDLDFGIPQFRHLAGQCTFPWLLGNVLDPGLGDNVSLGSCPKSLMLTSSNGVKIGVVGLVEREWLDTINSLPPGLIYKSATATAIELVPLLREQGAEMIVAVTHMREPNDVKLATKTPPGLIDLILGGHDHFYNHQILNKTHVLRSGSDFRQFSYIEARRKPDKQGWDFDITRRDIVRETPEDPSTVNLVEKLTSNLKTKLEKPIGYTAAPLDGRFTTVRTKESNLGNFTCDLMRYYYSADCTIMAAGTIRGDQIYPPGVLKLKMLMDCYPFEDPVVVIRVKGKAILQALENGLSKVPALEGRFPQVSNISFEFDPQGPQGSRILWTKIGDEPIDLEKEYVLSTRGYMARGKDGYDSLLVKSEGGEAEEIVSEENGVLISTILRQYFMSLKVLGKWRRWGPSLNRHWGGVQHRMGDRGASREPSSSSPASDSHTATATTPPKTSKHSRAGSLKPVVEPTLAPPSTSDKSKKTIVDGADVDSDTDDEDMENAAPRLEPITTTFSTSAEAGSPSSPSPRRTDRELKIARKVTRKWLRLAGIQREQVGMIEGKEWESEFRPHWTRGIYPKLEGRIVVSRSGG
ncbi:MAG: hypothetical protein M1837_002143 [Sclerophora amabilis]|nr:MAG: hypothetical protein M1837_002143 [Sclerophora amabilis]